MRQENRENTTNVVLFQVLLPLISSVIRLSYSWLPLESCKVL